MKKRITTGGKIISIFLAVGLALLMTPFTAKAEIAELPAGVSQRTDQTVVEHTAIEITGSVTINRTNDEPLNLTETNNSGYIDAPWYDSSVQSKKQELTAELLNKYEGKKDYNSELEYDEGRTDRTETTNLYYFESADGETVDLNGSASAVSDYFKDNPEAKGTLVHKIETHKYETLAAKYNISYTEKQTEEPAQPTTVNEVAIEGARLNYRAGDAPEKGAYVIGENASKCKVKYETWQQMKTNENGEDEPVAFWFSLDSMYNNSMKRITQFEEGNRYMYCVMLETTEGNIFAENCSVTINSESVPAGNAFIVAGKTSMYIPAFKSITPTKPAEQKEIEKVEINNVKTDFANGDIPVFTATLPENAIYRLVFEAWKTDGEGISNNDFFNDDDHLSLWGGKLITTFSKDKTYTYMVYLTTTAEGSNENWVFGPNTKLFINGKEVGFVRDSSDSPQHFKCTTDLTITPVDGVKIPDGVKFEGHTGNTSTLTATRLNFKITTTYKNGKTDSKTETFETDYQPDVTAEIIDGIADKHLSDISSSINPDWNVESSLKDKKLYYDTSEYKTWYIIKDSERTEIFRSTSASETNKFFDEHQGMTGTIRYHTNITVKETEERDYSVQITEPGVIAPEPNLPASDTDAAPTQTPSDNQAKADPIAPTAIPDTGDSNNMTAFALTAMITALLAGVALAARTIIRKQQ